MNKYHKLAFKILKLKKGNFNSDKDIADEYLWLYRDLKQEEQKEKSYKKQSKKRKKELKDKEI